MRMGVIITRLVRRWCVAVRLGGVVRLGSLGSAWVDAAHCIYRATTAWVPHAATFVPPQRTSTQRVVSLALPDPKNAARRNARYPQPKFCT
jgi:hypothetical protein